MISVIVPVYNVEKYLRKCVDSILAQTYGEFELLLVDDGSPDGCPQICDEYAERDSRVRVIHKPNGGLISARNEGIRACTGDYVCIVDGDDWADVHMGFRWALSRPIPGTRRSGASCCSSTIRATRGSGCSPTCP